MTPRRVVVGPMLAIAALCLALLALTAVLLDAQGRGGGPAVGRHANAWGAAAVGAAGNSATVDATRFPFCSAFGTTSAASTLTVQYSADGTNWYATSVNTGAVTGAFGINFTAGARYVRLSSSAAVTITATLQCKSAGGG